MNDEARKKLESMLTAGDRPVPPSDLLERIKGEIPNPIPRMNTPRPESPWAGAWKAAALVLIILGGVWAGFRLERRLVRGGTPVVREVQARSQEHPAAESGVFEGPVAKAAYISPDVQPSFQFTPDVQAFSQEKAKPYLDRGKLPPPDAVPPDAWMGIAEDEDFPSDRPGPALRMEGCPSPFSSDPRVKLLRVEVASPDGDFMVRRPMDLTVMMDLHGMDAGGMDLRELKAALEEAVRDLKSDDHLGLALEEGGAHVIVEPTTDRNYIFRVLDNIRDRGVTLPPLPPLPPAPPGSAPQRIHAVIRLAPQAPAPDGGESIRILEREDSQVRVRTIIVNGNGRMEQDSKAAMEDLKTREKELQQKGAELRAAGEGLRAGKLDLEIRIKQEADAARGLEKRLRETVQHMMMNEHVTVEFDPRTVDGYRLLGQSAVPAVLREEGSSRQGRKVLALYEVRLKTGQSSDAPVARVILRSEGDGDLREIRELVQSIRTREFARTLEQASGELRKAVLVARFTAAVHEPKGPDLRELKRLREETLRMTGEAVRQQQSMRDLLRWVEVAEGAPVPPAPPAPPEE